MLKRMGATAQVEATRPGYVPRGAGVVELTVTPAPCELPALTLTEPGVTRDVQGIALASHLALGVWVEVTTLVIPGVDHSDRELSEIAAFIRSVGPEVPWHVSRFYPTYRMVDRPETPVGCPACETPIAGIEMDGVK